MINWLATICYLVPRMSSLIVLSLALIVSSGCFLDVYLAIARIGERIVAKIHFSDTGNWGKNIGMFLEPFVI